jgi:tetratricopeptide (TPR) repeat protein
VLWQSAALLLFAASLLAKPIGALFPLMLLLLDVYPLRRTLSLPWPARACEKLPYFLLSITGTFLAASAKWEADLFRSFGEYGIGTRLLDSLGAVGFYLWKTFVPILLAPVYPPPGWSLRLLGGAMMLGIVFGYLDKRRLPCSTAGSAFGLFLLPFLAILRYGMQETADKWSYLAMIPLAIGMAGLIQNKGALFIAAAAAILAGWGILTARQTQTWHDSTALWGRTIRLHPTSNAAHNNLGIVRYEQQEYERALRHSNRALQSDPDLLALCNRGNAYRALGRIEQALEDYNRALLADPDFIPAHMLRGSLHLDELKAHDLAEADYRRALELDPENATAHYNLGVLARIRDKPEEALGHFTEAIRLDPYFAKAHWNRGKTHQSLGNAEAARRDLRQAEELGIPGAVYE